MAHPTPATSGKQERRSRRTRGLIAGAAIGGTVSLFGVLAASQDPNGIPLAPGALAGGAIGGWLFGPLAIAGRSRKRTALVLCTYAGLATLIADVVASTQVAFRTMPAGFTLDNAVHAIGNAWTLAGFGILIIGPLIFPLALLGAALWWLFLTAGE